MLPSYSLLVENELVPPGRLHLLVGDEDTMFARMLSEALELHDMTVVVAASGEEMLNRLRVEIFDGVVLDVTLPGIVGRDLLGLVRRRLPEGILILTTAWEREELFARLLHEGVATLLPKPLTGQSLIQALGSLRPGVDLWFVHRDPILSEWLRYLLLPQGYHLRVFLSLGEAIRALSAIRCEGLILRQENPDLLESETLLFLPEIDPRVAYIFLHPEKRTRRVLPLEGGGGPVIALAKPFHPDDLMRRVTDERGRPFSDAPDTKRPGFRREEDSYVIYSPRAHRR